MDEEQLQNQLDVYHEDHTNTSQQISTDFSQPFPNPSKSLSAQNDPEKSDSRSNSTIRSNHRAPPLSSAFSTQYSTDTEAPGINLLSHNMRQYSNVYDPIYEGRNPDTEEKPVNSQRLPSAVSKANVVAPSSRLNSASNSSVRRMPPNVRGGTAGVSSRVAGPSQHAGSRFDSSTPNYTVKASDSDGKLIQLIYVNSARRTS